MTRRILTVAALTVATVGFAALFITGAVVIAVDGQR